MFVDASAIVAILLSEPEADALLTRLEAVQTATTSPLAIYETVLALMRERRLSRVVAEQQVRTFLKATRIEVIPITDEIGRAALDAFDRYGKGRGHPARLNLGDCFAYGAAMTLGVPLLYKGDDFTETDLRRVG
jgi:ribonuclease VapC